MQATVFIEGGDREAAVVPTLPLDLARDWGRLWRHVRAVQETLQGRQGARLLERGGELPQPGRPGGAAAGAAPRRDQRQPTCGVVPVDRGARRRHGTGVDGAVRGGPGGAGTGLPGGAGQGEGPEPAPAAAMGGVLAGADAVGASGAGPVLGTAVAAEPAGHALAGHAEDAGVLPVDRSGQRVAAAPALVPAQRHGGLAGQPGGGGRRRHAVPLPGPAGRAPAGVLRVSAGTLGDAVRRALRRPAPRSDLDLLRERSAVRRQAPVRPQPRQAAGLRAGGDRAGGDPAGLSAGLRGDAGQHQRQDHTGGLPGEDRGAVRPLGPGVDHGPGHSHRGDAGGDARRRRAGALSGRHPQGPFDEAGEGVPGTALADGARVGRGEAAGRGRRTVHPGAEPRADPQGARHAAAAAEAALAPAARICAASRSSATNCCSSSAPRRRTRGAPGIWSRSTRPRPTRT